jgi:foldase protein PrsA
MVKEEKSGFKSVIQSKVFKGVALVAATAIITSGATYLAVNGGSSDNTNVITMKGDTITVSDFYDSVKTTSSSQQSMLTLILTRVFEEQYGDKVSDSKVAEAYNKTASSYGSSFSAALSSAGMTEDSYKQQIRTSMLVEYAVSQAAKELTDKNYESAYADYNTDTTAQVIKLSDETTANSVLTEAKADGADFNSIAEKNTTADTVEYTFDSADTDLPADVMNAAFGQSEGTVSDVITVLDSSTYTNTYYIVKTTKKTDKDSDWNTYKKRLKKIILAQYESDSSFQNQVIAAALEKANVKIKDSAFAEILSQYATTSSSSSTSSSTSSTDASSSSATEDSTSSESSSAE